LNKPAKPAEVAVPSTEAVAADRVA
jgi:hypothetical protein